MGWLTSDGCFNPNTDSLSRVIVYGHSGANGCFNPNTDSLSRVIVYGHSGADAACEQSIRWLHTKCSFAALQHSQTWIISLCMYSN